MRVMIIHYTGYLCMAV